MEKCLQDGIDDIFPENFQVYKCPIFVGSYYWLLPQPCKKWPCCLQTWDFKQKWGASSWDVTNKNSSFGFNKQKTSKDWISWDLVNKNWWFYFISQTTNRWFHGISSHHGGSPLLEKTRPTYAPGLGKLDAKGSRARAALEPRGSGFNGFRDVYTDLLLVGGWPTPLKNDGVKVSWDDEIPNMMGKS